MLWYLFCSGEMLKKEMLKELTICKDFYRYDVGKVKTYN